ncbi:MAG: serine O-acetyltransferase [Candidatus Obscuribacterales bacterium]|nr:serine O-acetyltransferase [Candidatus Obscuribacterales bacterium]
MDWTLINETADTILEKDPAARSKLEVYLCYPGFHAVALYRFANILYKQEQYTLARCLSQFARFLTGIEIHPGASIGRRFVIDHGMGVVIGETTVIGDDCFLYQGVTLGAGAEARQGEETRGTKRHPTLGNGVVVGSGAEIQGDISVGSNVRVASGSIVLKDVPDNSIVVGVPGRILYRDGKRVDNTTPDPEAEAIKRLKQRIDALEATLSRLMKASSLDTSLSSAEETAARGSGLPADGSDPVDVFLQGAGI